ncbi:uncharacterized protein LOC143078545 [Mytilus galloprovincialis]|uniref:uncharacterized protein LOC143078545 n=1 Tax=Mytilus galloprovincialis TaxID=29158 RepID=UPI003F7B4268
MANTALQSMKCEEALTSSLKTNPLYVTSGEVTNAEVGPLYGVVNKKKQHRENMTHNDNNDQGPVYSQVEKPIQEKKKGKDKKVKKTPRNENYNDIELGTVYENSDKLSKLNSSDELYANAGEQGKGVNIAKEYIPRKNKDGLIYADLDLMPGPNGGKFVIRGIENKTNYAMIDLSVKVDPLPSDDEEEEKDREEANSTANECNK